MLFNTPIFMLFFSIFFYSIQLCIFKAHATYPAYSCRQLSLLCWVEFPLYTIAGLQRGC